MWAVWGVLSALVMHNKLVNKMLPARLIPRIRLIMANRVEFYCFAYLNIISQGLLVRVFTPSLSAPVRYGSSHGNLCLLLMLTNLLLYPRQVLLEILLLPSSQYFEVLIEF